PLGGARGGGGSNWTGSYSGTASVNPSSIIGSISGYVYCLSNGVKTYAPGVTVTLTGPAGFTPQTTTTDANGFYSFNNLPVTTSGSQYAISTPPTITVNGTVCSNPIIPT